METVLQSLRLSCAPELLNVILPHGKYQTISSPSSKRVENFFFYSFSFSRTIHLICKIHDFGKTIFCRCLPDLMTMHTFLNSSKSCCFLESNGESIEQISHFVIKGPAYNNIEFQYYFGFRLSRYGVIPMYHHRKTSHDIIH